MSDVFISYAREDRGTAAALAQALEHCGWTVFWDLDIPAGKTFDQVIEKEVTGAACVVVLWSRHSIASDWVQTEASEAAARHILVPALIEDVRPPFAFRRIQAADLIGWDGGERHPGFANLVRSVASLVGFPGKPAKVAARRPPAVRAVAQQPAPAPPVRRRRGWGTVVFLALVAVVAFLLAQEFLDQGERGGGGPAPPPFDETEREHAEELQGWEGGQQAEPPPPRFHDEAPQEAFLAAAAHYAEAVLHEPPVGIVFQPLEGFAASWHAPGEQFLVDPGVVHVEGLPEYIALMGDFNRRHPCLAEAASPAFFEELSNGLAGYILATEEAGVGPELGFLRESRLFGVFRDLDEWLPRPEVRKLAFLLFNRFECGWREEDLPHIAAELNRQAGLLPEEDIWAAFEQHGW